MQGTWNYQSFLVLPADAEREVSAGSPVTAKKWAKGSLVILNRIDDGFSGELVFNESVKLSVKGKISPSANGVPAVLEAISEATEGIAQGAIYKITGWINPLSPDKTEPTQVQGSVLALCGPNSNPEMELGGMPTGTVGAFVLNLI
jgi:hypothetical protein